MTSATGGNVIIRTDGTKGGHDRKVSEAFQSWGRPIATTANATFTYERL